MGLTFLHVRGEPDWDWWTRRSDVACQVIDGAGSALGPVALPEDFVLPQRDAAWSALGFTKVRESELISAPRLTDFIDRKRLVAEGKLQNVLKVLTASDTPRFDQPGGPMHPINEAYNGLTGEDRRFTLEDLIGKSVIADITQQYQESNGKIVPLTHGFMALIEVAASDTTNRYAVDQTIAAHNRIDVKRGNTGKDSDTADYYRKKIRTIAEVDVGDTLAYLLPISGDLYLVLLSDFTLAAPKPAVTSQAPSGRGYTVELTNFRSTDDAQ